MTDQSRESQSHRRETMLRELTDAMRRHHRRRRLRRRIGTACALLLLAAGGAWMVRARPPAGPAEIPPDRHGVLVVGPAFRTGLVRVIDDGELMQRLAEIDRPAGLIRSEGRIWLTTAVADTELQTVDDPQPPL